jgi:hypothetical protein
MSPIAAISVLCTLVKIDAESGQLVSLDMIPFRVRNFRLNRADRNETGWLWQTMDRMQTVWQERDGDKRLRRQTRMAMNDTGWTDPISFR